jgi:hypothetical protein
MNPALSELYVVIPAKSENPGPQVATVALDPGFRGGDE